MDGSQGALARVLFPLSFGRRLALVLVCALCSVLPLVLLAVNTGRYDGLWAFLAGCVVTLVLAVGVARSVRAECRILAQTLDALMQGELNRRVPLVRADEFGAVAERVNALARHFGEVLISLTKTADELRNAATESDRAASAISQALVRQRELSKDSSQTLEKISGGLARSAVDMQTTATAADSSYRAADAGAEIASGAAAQLDTLVAEMSASQAAIAALDQRARKISEVVQLIRDIADQTNLLALNAAIEAARVGESGRGFAVVADEVRKLAERSHKATQDIALMVGEVQTEVRRAVDMIDRGNHMAQTGARSVLQTAEALSSIRSEADQVRALASDMAGRVNQQSAASQSMVGHVEEGARLADANARHVSESAGVANYLAGLAEQMTQLLRAYRV